MTISNTTIFCLLFAPFTISCSFKGRSSGTVFTANKSEQGIEVLENKKPVLFYQQKPKSLSGEFVCSNYIHPLYNLKGDTLTEEFPASHPHHRGIFWAWHQIYAEEKNIGDSWIMKSVFFDVANVQIKKNKDRIILNLSVNWKSLLYQNASTFMEEFTSVTVYKMKNGIRKIDFGIRLTPIAEGIQIGGSEEKEKGYGGFCARIKTPPDIVFTSSKGIVTPLEGQVGADARMDFSGSYGDKAISGLTILCHPSNPAYPTPWILRQSGSMQNPVFPGAEKFKLTKPVQLHYRLIVHDGNASTIDLDFLQAEYQKIDFGISN